MKLILLLLIVFFTSSATDLVLASVPMKVMSVNILEDNGSSSTNPDRWVHSGGPDRRDRLLQVIADFDPST